MILVLGAAFRELQNARKLPVNEPMKVVWADNSYYAVSPDGEGCYYYDTLEELQAQH